MAPKEWRAETRKRTWRSSFVYVGRLASKSLTLLERYLKTFSAATDMDKLAHKVRAKWPNFEYCVCLGGPVDPHAHTHTARLSDAFTRPIHTHTLGITVGPRHIHGLCTNMLNNTFSSDASKCFFLWFNAFTNWYNWTATSCLASL